MNKVFWRALLGLAVTLWGATSAHAIANTFYFSGDAAYAETIIAGSEATLHFTAESTGEFQYQYDSFNGTTGDSYSTFSGVSTLQSNGLYLLSFQALLSNADGAISLLRATSDSGSAARFIVSITTGGISHLEGPYITSSPTVSLDSPVSAVPEPESVVMMLAGLAAIAGVVSRRKSALPA